MSQKIQNDPVPVGASIVLPFYSSLFILCGRMPAVTRKRLRDTPVEAETTAASIMRRVLASRVEPAAPYFWRHAASSNGVSGTDALLVLLGRSVAASLHVVTESAETARAKLRETRAALHAAIDARCDELGVNIDSAESIKVAALERELFSVDAALERWRAESAAVREAVSSLSDADLEAQHATLSSHLDGMEAYLQALPTAVIEPPFVGLLADAPALLSSIADFGRVLAPLPITVADLSLEGVPSKVRPGGTLRLRLSLGARHAAQSAEELEVSLGRLAEMTRVDATQSSPGLEPQSLEATLASDAAQRCLHISLDVPLAASDDASVDIIVASVAGQAMSGLRRCVPVHRGITPPLVLSCASAAKNYTTPCISPEGRVYCPPGEGPEVLVFDAEGLPLPGLPVASIGLSKYTSWAAYAPGDMPSLVLADGNGPSSRLVAVDPATRTARWSSGVGYCTGIAALSAIGVVVVGCMISFSAYRISDGARAGSLAVSGLGIFLAADDTTGAVYGTVSSGTEYSVHAWECIADGAGIRMTSNGPVTAAGSRDDPRPLAVMPPAPGKTASHLVIGTDESPELLVLSLPGLSLVHTHILEEMRVTGLAADPWGEFLAVYDMASSSLHVLAWPLPGMPPLQ